MKTLTRQYVSEIAGTFILVFFGCGTAMATGANIVAESAEFSSTLISSDSTIFKNSRINL